MGQIREEILGMPTFLSDMPSWDFSSVICDMLQQYAEEVSAVPVIVTGLGQ